MLLIFLLLIFEINSRSVTLVNKEGTDDILHFSDIKLGILLHT